MLLSEQNSDWDHPLLFFLFIKHSQNFFFCLSLLFLVIQIELILSQSLWGNYENEPCKSSLQLNRTRTGKTIRLDEAFGQEGAWCEMPGNVVLLSLWFTVLEDQVQTELKGRIIWWTLCLGLGARVGRKKEISSPTLKLGSCVTLRKSFQK